MSEYRIGLNRGKPLRSDTPIPRYSVTPSLPQPRWRLPFSGRSTSLSPLTVSSDSNSGAKTFWQQSNDLNNRAWRHRLARFARANFQRGCARLLQLADDPRVVTAWRHGWDADHFIRLLRCRDRGFRPRIVYDIGAHEGRWTEMCQSIFSPAQCFLFEPQPDYQARAKTRQPAGARWEVIPVALGDAEQIRQIYVTENDTASSLLRPLEGGVPPAWGTRTVNQREVQIATLDELAAKNKWPAPDLVKIDVQGYEGRVIAGGKNVLSQAQRLVVEVSLHAIYSEQSLLPEIAGTLSGWGYEIEDMNDACREWAGRLWQADLWWRRAGNPPTQ